MENYDSQDASSLQAILYVDEASRKAPKVPHPHRLPNIVTVGLCIIAAACAVSAVTYKVKLAPASTTTAQSVPLRVTHAAAGPQRITILSAPLHTRTVVPLQKSAVMPKHVAAKPGMAKSVAIKPVVPKAVAPKVAMAKPIAAHPIAVKAVVHARPVAITAKPVAHKIVAVAQAPAASVIATPHRHHPHHVHHVHRSLAALSVHPHSTMKYAMLAKAPAVAATDPTITAFSASPASIPQGSGATICVSARHASQLSISSVGELNPLLLDCRHVSPVVTTTYTAWAVNNQGVTVSQNVTVNVTH